MAQSHLATRPEANGTVPVEAEAPSTTAGPGRTYISNLPESALIIDARYQRELSAEVVLRLARHFSWEAFGTLEVSKRAQGLYAVFDGQHRLAVVRKLHPGAQLPCIVHEHLSVMDEAYLFELVNGQRAKPNAKNRFRSRLFRNEPTAREITDLAHECGYRVDLSRGAKSGPVISSISSLEKMHAQYGPDTLRQALLLALATWPDDPQVNHGDMLQGLAQFLVAYNGDVDVDRVRLQLAGGPVAQLLRQAAGLRTMLGGGTPINVARAILKRYNERLTTRRLPEGVLAFRQA